MPSKGVKPPYRIPSRDEMLSVPSNGLTALSTFSGTGGVCAGYRWAGFDVLGASEFVPAAAATYSANFPNTPIDTRDIRTVTAADLLSMAGVSEIDVLEGSPPCASFSMAGKREALWGKEKKYSDVSQVVDDLFDEYVRLVSDLRPKAFTAENVTGLTVGVARGYLRQILSDLRSIGYRVEAAVLDASYLGVPQARKRVFFVGFREDLKLDPVFPAPLPYQYTLRDALLDCPDPRTDEEAPSFEAMAIGREWKRLQQGASSDRYFRLSRASWGKPSPTLTAMAATSGSASVTHPDEPRKFNVPELKRISGFPDDWTLLGEYQKKVERLGRAVPPPMARAVAKTIAKELLK